jgi:hypothetical protein
MFQASAGSPIGDVDSPPSVTRYRLSFPIAPRRRDEFGIFSVLYGVLIFGGCGILFVLFPLVAIRPLPPGMLPSMVVLWREGRRFWLRRQQSSAADLTICDGRLTLTGWRGAPIDVPIEEVKRATIERPKTPDQGVLTLWVGTREIAIDELRLAGRIDEVMSALRAAHLQAGTEQAFLEASEAKALRRWKLKRGVPALLLFTVAYVVWYLLARQ